MKTWFNLPVAALLFPSASVMAHAGPAAAASHLIEHLLILLAIGVPSLLALLRLRKRRLASRR